MSAAARKLRDNYKDLARESARAAGVVEARVSRGEFTVSVKHAVERLRNVVEILDETVRLDAELLDPDYADDELRALTAQLDDRIAALEERIAAGPAN